MSIDTSGGHPAMDYAEHQRTYARFLKGAVISVGIIAAILVVMAIFLT